MKIKGFILYEKALMNRTSRGTVYQKPFLYVYYFIIELSRFVYILHYSTNLKEILKHLEPSPLFEFGKKAKIP